MKERTKKNKKEEKKYALHIHNGGYQAFSSVFFLMLLPITSVERYWKWFQDDDDDDETNKRETSMYISAFLSRITEVSSNVDYIVEPIDAVKACCY